LTTIGEATHQTERVIFYGKLGNLVLRERIELAWQTVKLLN